MSSGKIVAIVIAMLAFVGIYSAVHDKKPMLARQSMSLNQGPSESVTGLSIPGFAPIYNAAGTAYTNPKCVADSTSSATTTGLWSINISALSFTSIKSVQVQAVSTAATAAGTVNAGVSTVSTTSVGGITTVPSGSVLGLIPLTANPVAAVVYVQVCGI